MRWSLVLAALSVACGSAKADVPLPRPKSFIGVAAFYDVDYKGRTANGGRYDPSKFTAAHKTLPFGTHLRVTDRGTGRSVVVVVTDRGPFTRGRSLDLSLAAAKTLHMTQRGLIQVTATIVPASYTVAAKPDVR